MLVKPVDLFYTKVRSSENGFLEMTSSSYNWNRRWILQGTREDQTVSLSALTQRWFSSSSSTNAKRFSLDELSNIPVLILLGEPGIGKSSEINSYFQRLLTSETKHLRKFLEYPPRTFSQFFNQPQFESWRNGASRLVLFVDSFDEDLRSPLNLGRELAEALSDFSDCLKNLNLRIACRTADWAEDTTVRLQHLFGKENILTIELDTLGQKEVIEAATSHGINDYQFLELIEQNALTALTLKPITLTDLLKGYLFSDGVLPTTRNALYENMCRRLCEEHNQYHDENDRHGNFTVDELFTEAARLATIMLTTRRLSIWMPSSTKDIPDGSIAIEELHHGTSAEDRLTRTTLHTGFFSSRGPHQLGWAHLSYAEYLAAVYMHNNLSLAQIKSLLVHPNGNKIIPQLREVTGWLTTMNPTFLEFVVNFDPEALFQSDLIVEDIEAREKLTTVLLELYDSETLVEIPFNSHLRYRRLNHPRLANQLSDFIQDTKHNETSRYVAISMIHACQLQDAVDHLVKIALNQKSEHSLRDHAAYVVARIGSKAAKSSLKPLINMGELDVDDQLKGAALIATWPDYLTTSELFAILTPRKRESFIGNYSLFLRAEILDYIAVTDLPIALHWAEKFIEKHTDIHHHVDPTMQALIDEILYRSWVSFDTPEVCRALAQLILAKVTHHHPLFGTNREKLNERYQSVVNDLLRNESKRRQLLIEIINLVTNLNFNYHALNYPIPLLLDTDLIWLLSLLETNDSPIPSDILLRLIEVVFRRWNINHMTEMALAMERIEVLPDMFGHWFYVKLDSDYANDLRQAHKREQEYEAKRREIETRRQEQLIAPPPLTRLGEILDQCEQGKFEEWWRTNTWLATNEYGNFSDWYGDIRQMPNWEQIDQSVKDKVLSLGLQFVLNCSPETDKWLGKYALWRPAIAGYRMLFLLFDLGAKIPADILERWTIAIITFPHHFVQTEHQKHNQFFAMVYENNKHEFRLCFKNFLEHWHNPELDISIVENYLSRIDSFFDDSLAQILLEYLKNPQIKPKHYSDILNWLLRKHLPEACSIAASDFRKLYDQHRFLLQQLPLLCSLRAKEAASKLQLAKLIQKKFKESANSRMESARLAANLITSPVHGDWWYSIWELIQSDVDFGRQIIETTSGIYGDRRVARIAFQLPEDEVADLYLWIAEQYPHDEDPELNGWVSPRHTVSDWRNSILNQLTERGTPEALAQLERIAQTYPDLYQLKRLRKHLLEQLHKQTWQPPLVSDLLALLKNVEMRYVQTDGQLLDLVLESLARLQKRLQGETPSAVDLWSIVPLESICRPKDERALSNYVKRHLEQDLAERGIVVSREVEIRQKEGGEGAAKGEVPDIYVSAFSHNTKQFLNEPLIVLIEIKGCWNQDLKTAAQNQLVGRYLRDNDRATSGLYLVGWFNCQQWDQNDTRRSIAFRNELNVLQDELEAQVERLSNNHLDVRVFILDASLRYETH